MPLDRDKPVGTDDTFPEYFQNACYRQFFEGAWAGELDRFSSALQYTKIK